MKINKFNGIELLEKIRSNEIEMNTNINVYYDDVFRTTLVFDGYDLNWKAGEFKVAYFYDGLCHFEIEEEKEIEKIEFFEENLKHVVAKTTSGIDFALGCFVIETDKKINELIEAVNKIKRG